MKHAGTDFAVDVLLQPRRLRVEVFDGDSRPPVLVVADADATSGRGLRIVAGLADDWGWRTSSRDGISGKAVWASWGLSEGAGTVDR